MIETKNPPGWNEDRIRKVIAHYDVQTDDEAVAEDEEGVRPSEVVMSVPRELVPEIRELIAKRQR
jgi:hypothetical protein